MAEDSKAKAKKEKPPEIEEKPFPEFIEQHFVPDLDKAFAEAGIDDMSLNFVNEPVPIKGASSEPCWQVKGSWNKGTYQFIVYFPDEDIKGQKGFSFATNGKPPSILESFMIDERRVNLDLMVLYVLQRINAEKLLVRN
ncbi:MAG: DUF2996 domain-containing protein [Jaaginema sp. PMC 1079.18]|nr:DUF2996 domain-containing protein [Jaaginema sp. PMC 1080.18]MEC4849760.1 DUF2996 domain-containing protein [Jaaginema sp. PMC 1079.18]MEC4866624.1 DUF2996 domain-containing protein [Jaaginema sp. PMC 1078.18]